MSFQVSNLFISSYDQTSLIQVARKSSDQTISNDTSLPDDADLVLPVIANSFYILNMWVVFSSSAVADFKCSFRAITGATGSWNAVTATYPNALSGTQSLSGVGVGTEQCYHIYGIVETGANSGNLQFRWSQNTAEVSNTVLTDKTTLTLRKIA